MKLIIDIPEDELKEMKAKEFISIESIDTAIECIKNGAPLDGVTNGEVIQALFSNTNVLYDTEDDLTAVYFSGDFWNAPYQKGDKDEET